MNITEHVRQMLELARKTLEENPDLTKKTGSINAKGDETIAMDTKIESLFIDYVRQNNIPANIWSEEIGLVSCPNPEYVVAFDPLDGSTNYKIGHNLLPYGCLIAVYKGATPKLKDIIAAGAVEITTGKGWIFDGKVTKTLEGQMVQLRADWEIHKSTPVQIDLYWIKAVKTFADMFGKLHLKWGGSNISSLLYVLTNSAAVMGGVGMRAEEIGAIVGLIKGAGGKVCQVDGTELNEESFSGEKTYPILAGAEKIVDFMVEDLR
jgi:fructose-1,6-bisphosphatase/inositol monophosphatase family enzyme